MCIWFPQMNRILPDSGYMSLFVVYRDNLVRDALYTEKASPEFLKSTHCIPRKSHLRYLNPLIVECAEKISWEIFESTNYVQIQSHPTYLRLLIVYGETSQAEFLSRLIYLYTTNRRDEVYREDYSLYTVKTSPKIHYSTYCKHKKTHTRHLDFSGFNAMTLNVQRRQKKKNI